MAGKKNTSELVDTPPVKDADLKKGKVKNDYSGLIEGSGGYNPFGEEVVERDYTKPKVVAQEGMPPIAEPSFEPPSIEDFDSPNPELDASEGEPSKGDNMFTTEDLPDKEKKIACENIVDTFLGAYGLLHEWGYKWVSVSEEQQTEHIMNGDIDPSLEYPLSSENNITFSEFCDSYNEQVKDILTVDDEFIEEVRPRLIRIAMTHDMGMTDVQFCIYKFSVDIAQKGGAIYSFKKQMNLVVDQVSKLTKEYQANNPMPPQSPPPPHNTPPEQSTEQPPVTPPNGMDVELENQEIYLEPEEKPKKKGKKAKPDSTEAELLPPDADQIKETEEK